MGLLTSLFLLGTKPQNELEIALLGFLKEKLDLPQFLTILMRSRALVLTKGPPEALPPRSGPLATPVMDGADGRPAFCVFTHPQRIRALQARQPEYSHALEMDFPDLVRLTPMGFGMLFNPGNALSTEVLPEGIDELRA